MAKKKAKKIVKKVVKKTAKKQAKKAAPKKPAKKKTNKKVTKIAAAKAPKRTTTISPYLTFPGNCEDAFNFYRSVFGGQFPYIGRFKDMPPMPGQPPISEEDANKIMHVSLPISEETILMGSDSSEAFGHATNIGNNFSISINAKSKEDADKLFNGLSHGGHVVMPMDKTFWGSYFGMFTDKFKIQWLVSFDEKPGQN